MKQQVHVGNDVIKVKQVFTAHMSRAPLVARVANNHKRAAQVQRESEKSKPPQSNQRSVRFCDPPTWWQVAYDAHYEVSNIMYLPLRIKS